MIRSMLSRRELIRRGSVLGSLLAGTDEVHSYDDVFNQVPPGSSPEAHGLEAARAS